jgi:hypothetical protein
MTEKLNFTPQKFRKKPVVIEACQLRKGNTWESIAEWCGGHFLSHEIVDAIVIPTLEGDMTATYNDWIIRGVKGEFYPCKPDIFEVTYEPA